MDDSRDGDTMQKVKASIEYQHDATLGEGPVWDEREGRLYWVDILSGTLFRYDPAASRNRAHDLGEHLGAGITLRLHLT